MPITHAEYLAIMLRANAVILSAQLGDDDKVSEGYKRLNEFVSALASPTNRPA